MTFQLPTDLIHQVQIALRNDVGLTTYDPHDPTLPSLPSISASIAGIEPSTPPYLRCKNCKGKLLRGVQSLICIYCGKQQQNKDLPPDPISFTSTFAYRWLLQSLQLDESVTIEPATEEPETKRGKNTTKQDLSLRDLLDLQITWSAEPEKPETIAGNEPLEQHGTSFDLSGADLENVFSGSGKDLGGTPSEPVAAEKIDSTETGASVGQENLSLFSTLPPAESAVTSSEYSARNSFSGWAADFQSASKHEDSKSLDPFPAPTVDFSSHIDSVFGSGKDYKTRELEDESRPAPSMSYDWMKDDLWGNLNPMGSQQVEHIGSSVEATDSLTHSEQIPPSDGLDWFGDTQWQTNITHAPTSNSIGEPHHVDNPSSERLDWLEDAQWQTNIKNAPTSNTIDEPDDAFDEWNDFTSSTNAPDPPGMVWSENSAVIDGKSEINLFSSSSLQDDEFGSFSQPNFFSNSHGIQNDAASTNPVLHKDPASVRIDNAHSNVDDSLENFDFFVTTTQATQSKDDVEMLMSQMHDLSFMLESNLSVPSKLDGHSSTHD